MLKTAADIVYVLMVVLGLVCIVATLLRREGRRQLRSSSLPMRGWLIAIVSGLVVGLALRVLHVSDEQFIQAMKYAVLALVVLFVLMTPVIFLIRKRRKQ